MEVRVFIPFELLIVFIAVAVVVVRRLLIGVSVVFDRLDQRVQLTVLIEVSRKGIEHIETNDQHENDGQ